MLKSSPSSILLAQKEKKQYLCTRFQVKSNARPPQNHE